MKNSVLLIDDDERLGALVKEYLETNALRVTVLTSGTRVLETIAAQPVDLVILDIMLPEKDGLEVLREIRKAHSVPVIMLTAKGDETDRIVGLELGADDYLAKPFNPRELLARIKAVLRRSTTEAGDGGIKPAESGIVESGGVWLNCLAQTARVDGMACELSTTEFRLLEVLMKHPNTVLSRDQLMTLVRGRDFMAFDRSIDVHISKLRAKLEPDPRSPRRIKTIWGTGYMFVDQP